MFWLSSCSFLFALSFAPSTLLGPVARQATNTVARTSLELSSRSFTSNTDVAAATDSRGKYQEEHSPQEQEKGGKQGKPPSILRHDDQVTTGSRNGLYWITMNLLNTRSKETAAIERDGIMPGYKGNQKEEDEQYGGGGDATNDIKGPQSPDTLFPWATWALPTMVGSCGTYRGQERCAMPKGTG